jgi:bifunctional UDP-N-acetylglucosamine pyrophosphorylase/glucosamine-1-phosphate N-acetyltransferase
LEGETVIEEDVELGANNQIKDSYILKGAKVTSSYINKSVIGKYCKVGPFAHIHDKSIMEEDAEVGSFVELKQAKLEKNSKVKRLSFVGKE